MQKFSVQVFYDIGRLLASLNYAFESLIEENSPSMKIEPHGISGESLAQENLASIKIRCTEIGLKISVKAADHVLFLLSRTSTLAEVKEAMTHLERTIAWEMGDRLFTYVPPDRAAFYGQTELFGKDVNTKFPNIQYDMVEAGNSYAAGRGTATVFHLMRIMETGVQELGKKLGVSLVNEKNWQNIIEEIDKAIRTLPKTPQRSEISQVSGNLYAVKLAWRNEVMHPKDTYTLEEAENLIRLVKVFMEQLAKIV